ncbi:MAG: hypothetical protein Q7U10_00425 [Thermodesulfovibrionia bacterium]|nr:hypothetical protein [Thermodesulfovibrionia bacterium]
MKKIVTGLALIALLAVGAVVYAHGHGSGGGHKMGQGFDGGDMMGAGCGGRQCGIDNEEGRKFLDETYSLRKEMHDKKFEYREALRNPDTTIAAITKLEREIQSLKESIREKAPKDSQMRMGSRDGSCRH